MGDIINIVIADAHYYAALGLQTMLSHQPGMQLLAIAGSGDELLKLAEEHAISVIITDPYMPGVDGIEAIKHITGKQPAINIIAHTASRGIYNIDRVIKAGAKGYVFKCAPQNEILYAIITVSSGENYYCPGALKIMNELKKSGHLFTKSEYDILPYICEGKCDKEIAVLMHLCPRTIQNRRANMRQKLQVTTNDGLVKYAMQQGFAMVSVLTGFITCFAGDAFLQDALQLL